MMKIFFLISISIMLCGCSVPEFEVQSPPPEVPVFGELITAKATWYGTVYHGRRTDSGDEFDMEKLTASHFNLPFGSIVEVTNPKNGKSVKVLINDRHNLEKGYALSVSRKAAQVLGLYPNKTFVINYMLIE